MLAVIKVEEVVFSIIVDSLLELDFNFAITFFLIFFLNFKNILCLVL